jgi:hypothetical protein
MNAEQKDRILAKAKAHAEDAKQNGSKIDLLKLRPDYTDSLAQMIKTKEQADLFRFLLDREINK